MELFKKAGVLGRPRASADYNYSERDKTNRRVGAMSAPPFFQSAGRGELFFWGGKEGPTVVIWESLSEQEKKSWLEESSTIHDWVVWCKSKKGAEEIRSFELSGKENFFK